MPTWHRLGSRDDLLARVPFSVKLDRQQIAVFLHEGRFRAIGNRCNHKGGPLCEGQVRGEYVMCPWHAWEYSVVTGKGPPGYEAEAGAGVRGRGAGRTGCMWTPIPFRPGRLVKPRAASADRDGRRATGSPPRVLGISTTAMDASQPPVLDVGPPAGGGAGARGRDKLGAETRLVRLRDLAFRACEGNYSKAAHACTWPCAITERDPEDQLTPVYEGLVQWGDVVLIATPIRWGAASSLYHRMAERLNCIQNQITIHNRCADSPEGGGVHHHRRAGQRAGRGRADAHLLGGAGLRLPAVSVHRPLARAGMRRTWRPMSGWFGRARRWSGRRRNWRSGRWISGGCWTSAARRGEADGAQRPEGAEAGWRGAAGRYLVVQTRGQGPVAHQSK